MDGSTTIARGTVLIRNGDAAATTAG